MDKDKLTKALAKEQLRPITIEEAIARLDLTPFDQFVPPANAPEGRATGQTTKMLVEAVVRSQYEPVTIRAHTQRYARYLIRDARLMAARLGLDPNRIGETGYVFTDHYQPKRQTMSYTPANATTALEDALQARMAESEQWYLAATDNGRRDTSSRLTALGFEVGEKEGLFYKVSPPVGFTKKTEGYWTYVMDSEGSKIITQFYKAAPWDTDAFLRFQDTAP